MRGRTRSIFGTVFLLASQVAGCVLAIERAPAAAQGPLGGQRRVSLGLCEDYPEKTSSLDELRRDLGLLEAARVDVLRVSVRWDAVEPQRDQYEFGFWDEVVGVATEAGVKLIPYVTHTPRWNSDGAADSFWKAPPRDVEEFAELMQILAERYRGRIQSWEIWNEPDNEEYWLGSAEQFARLLAAGSAGVRAGDSDARVVLGGLAGGVDFLRELFDEHGAGERVDVVNLHGYYETWNPNPLETLPQYIGEVRDIVKRHGGHQALWMAEVGYSNFVPAPGQPAASVYSYEHTPEFQAVMLTRTLALLLSEPAVSLVAWYEVKDPRLADSVVGDAHERHLGVAFADHRPKPALDALAFVSELFGAGFRVLDRELYIDTAPGSSAVVRGFTTAARELVLVAWLPTHLPAAPSAAPERSTPRHDGRREIVRVVFPQRARGPASRHDATGEPQGELPVDELRGHSEVELELSGGEVQVLRIAIDAEH